MRTIKVLSVVAVLAVTGIACSSSDNGGAVNTPPPSTPAASSSSPGAAPIAVSATDALAFTPPSLTIKVGTTVKWTVTGSVPHTVTSPEPGTQGVTFDSGTLNQGQSFPFTFTTAGTYHYYCKIHGKQMSGTITVTS